MTTPIVTELPRWMEATTRDPFLDEAPSAVRATPAIERAERLLASSAAARSACPATA